MTTQEPTLVVRDATQMKIYRLLLFSKLIPDSRQLLQLPHFRSRKTPRPSTAQSFLRNRPVRNAVEFLHFIAERFKHAPHLLSRHFICRHFFARLNLCRLQVKSVGTQFSFVFPFDKVAAIFDFSERRQLWPLARNINDPMNRPTLTTNAMPTIAQPTTRRECSW